jgi:hypothetical protein
MMSWWALAWIQGVSVSGCSHPAGWLHWFALVHTGSHWFALARTGSHWFALVRTVPTVRTVRCEWFALVRTVRNGAKLFVLVWTGADCYATDCADRFALVRIGSH